MNFDRLKYFNVDVEGEIQNIQHSTCIQRRSWLGWRCNQKFCVLFSLSLFLWRQSQSLSSSLNQCFTLLCYHQTSINSKHRGIADNDFPNICYRNLMWCKDYIYIFYFQHKGRHRRRASKENGNLRLSEGQNHLFGKYSTFFEAKNDLFSNLL